MQPGSIDPNTLLWAVPTVTVIVGAITGWLVSNARAAGRAEALGESQRAATRALHDRIDQLQHSLVDLQQSLVDIREILVKADMLEPGTSPGRPNPLIKR